MNNVFQKACDQEMIMTKKLKGRTLLKVTILSAVVFFLVCSKVMYFFNEDIQKMLEQKSGVTMMNPGFKGIVEVSVLDLTKEIEKDEMKKVQEKMKSYRTIQRSTQPPNTLSTFVPAAPL